MPDNIDAWAFIQRSLPGLIRGDGGYDFQSFVTVLDVFEVDRGKRPLLFEKMLVYVDAHMEVRIEEDQKHGRR
jgi:hypothetical protein